MSVHFIPFDIAARLLVALGVGMLVGFEREWARKDPGVRTFTLVSLAGMLADLASPQFAWIAMGAVVLLAVVMNLANLALKHDLELTTSVALIVTFILGVLVGQGHVFTPTASAILMTLLLSLKPQLTRFAGGVSAEEVRSAVLLGLIGFVIYPVLPNRAVDPWNLFNPREAWLTVILIAGIGFVNYVLLKTYSSRGLYYTAFFGGLVNSTATVAELASAEALRANEGGALVTFTMLTVIAMFLRNLILVAVFSPRAALIAIAPIAAMAACTVAFEYRNRTIDGTLPLPRSSSPVSILKIAKFGLFFVLVQALGAVGSRTFGRLGNVVISFIGGLVSSASATAAVGSLTARHIVTAQTAAISAVMASVASTLVNLPIVYRSTKFSRAFRHLLFHWAFSTGLGLIALWGSLTFLK